MSYAGATPDIRGKRVVGREGGEGVRWMEFVVDE